MPQVFPAIIFLFFLIPAPFSFAQSRDDWPGKIYSGYFQQKNPKNHEDTGRQCSVEFKSPVSFTQQWVAQVPEELTYFIRFKDGAKGPSPDNAPQKGAFDKFIIEIFSNDGQEYSLDPFEEGKQVGIDGEHHIFDSYLIYLILGHDIDHLEVASPSGDDRQKYVLDKLEIRNND